MLLILTVLLSILTMMPGRVTRLQETLHPIPFAAFLFLAIIP